MANELNQLFSVNISCLDFNFSVISWRPLDRFTKTEAITCSTKIPLVLTQSCAKSSVLFDYLPEDH